MPIEQRPSWYTDLPGYIREGIEENRGLRETDAVGRPQKGGILENLTGAVLGAGDGSDYRQAKIDNDFKKQIEELDGTFESGKSEAYNKLQVRKLKKARQSKEFKESPEGQALETNTGLLKDASKERTDARVDGNNIARETLKVTADNNTNQLELARMESQQRHNQFMMSQADNKDARAMELQMRREDMDRLDRRDEKNRRRESIQALVAGLSSLGAAFAV